MIFRLIALNGPLKGQRITVPIEPMAIGRDPGCLLVLEDEEVARRHARVEHRPDGLFIRDLGSMNRILVNKREVREAHLKHGDVLEIGRTTFLVQAFVQAEIEGEPADRKRRRRTVLRTVGAIALVALASGVWAHLREARRRPAQPPPAPVVAALNEAPPAPPAPATVTTAPPVVAAVPAPASAETNRPAPAGTVPSPREEQMTEELQRMHEAVRDLRAQMHDLAARPPPAPLSNAVPAGSAAVPAATNAPVATPAPEPAPPPAAPAARELEVARDEMAAGRLDEADARLARLQAAEPEFLSAYEERALLFERRGLLEKALGQWSQIIQHRADSPLAEKAAGEWSRLTKSQLRRTATEPQRVRIASVQAHRFPETADYEEMRLLRIALEPVGTPPPPLAGVSVEVVFFNQRDATGEYEASGTPNAARLLRPAGDWPADGAKTLTAAYVVPPGFRAGASAGLHFGGHVVRVYLDDKLQDEDARPIELLARPAGRDGGAVAAGKAASR